MELAFITQPLTRGYGACFSIPVCDANRYNTCSIQFVQLVYFHSMIGLMALVLYDKMYSGICVFGCLDCQKGIYAM